MRVTSFNCTVNLTTALQVNSHFPCRGPRPKSILLSQRSMRIILLLTIIIAFLSLSVMDEAGHFKCGASLCGRTFNTSGGLLRHRPTCVYYQQQSAVIRARSRHKRHLPARETGNSLASKKPRWREDTTSVRTHCSNAHFCIDFILP